MLNIEVFFIFNLLFSMTSSQKLLLIGSRLVSESSVYELVLSAFNLSENSIVNVTFKAGNDEEQVQTLRGFGAFLFEEVVHFRVAIIRESQFLLSLKYFDNSTSSCMEQTIQLVDIFRRPIVIITTDKPVYEAGEEVKIRVFVVSREWLPIVVPSMDISIYDSKNETIQTFSNVQTSDFGVHDNSIQIPKSPTFGEWKIVVHIFGYKKSHPFQVNKKREIQFHVNLMKMLSKSFHTLEIIARKSGESLLIGTADIVARSKSNQILNNHKLCKRIGPGMNRFTFSINKDIQLEKFYKFEIKFKEDLADDSTVVEFEAERKSRFEEVKFDLKRYYYPNEYFAMKMWLVQKNGELNPLLDFLEAVITCSAGNTHFSRTARVDLINGIGYVYVVGEQICKKLIIEVVYPSTSPNPSYSYPSKDFDVNNIKPYMSVQKIAVGNIRVSSNVPMGDLYLMIISPIGITQFNRFLSAHGKTEFNVDFSARDEMMPESYVIAYYIRSDTGKIVHNANVLNWAPGLYRNNRLLLIHWGNVNSDNTFYLTITSEIGSKVYLYMVDGLLPRPKHEVTQRMLVEEKFIHRDFNFENPSSYDFGKFNAFVMDLFQEGAKCGTKEPVVNQKYFNLDRDLDSPRIEIPNKKYFSEAVQLPFIGMKKRERTIAINVPRDSSSIRIYGYSVHRTKGITYEEISISLPKDLAVKIFVTESATAFKIIKVRYAIFNFLKGQVEADVNVSVENATVIDEDIEDSFELNYLPSNWNLKWRISGTSLSERREFFVLSNSSSPVQINITASLNENHYFESKIIRIKESEALPSYKINVLIFPSDYFKISAEAYRIDKEVLFLIIKVVPIILTSEILVIDVALPGGYKYKKHRDTGYVKDVTILPDLNVVSFHIKGLKEKSSYILIVDAEEYKSTIDRGDVIIKIRNLNGRRGGSFTPSHECDPLDIANT